MLEGTQAGGGAGIAPRCLCRVVVWVDLVWCCVVRGGCGVWGVWFWGLLVWGGCWLGERREKGEGGRRKEKEENEKREMGEVQRYGNRR